MHLSRIPSGVRYYVGDAARQRRAVEDCAISVFAGWSYEEIATPTIDYYSLFEQGMGAEAQTSFRFVDVDARLLALRPDVTSSVARACATLLAEKPRPLRLCYASNVFHQQPRTQAEWRRETTQLGCELIGASGIAADVEPLLIVVETLKKLGLEGKHRITINNVAIFDGIAEGLGLNSESREQLRALIDARDTAALTELLTGLGVDDDERDLFVQITRRSGKRRMIDEARKVITNLRSREALKVLAETWNVIETLGLADSFEIDLGDVPDLDYYTGLLFNIYVAGSGMRVGRGGRYDGLTSKFGKAEPATGFVLDLDELTNVVAPRRVPNGNEFSTVAVNADNVGGFEEAMRRRAADERICLRL